MTRKLKPIHPGEHLREDFMKPLGLKGSQLAESLEVPASQIYGVLRERRSITADLAMRLARFFRTDARSWLNLQSHYDMQCVEDESGVAIRRIRPLRREHEPVA